MRSDPPTFLDIVRAFRPGQSAHIRTDCGARITGTVIRNSDDYIVVKDGDRALAVAPGLVAMAVHLDPQGAT